MATAKVKEIRQPLHTNPTSNFTLKRGEHKKMETVKLVSHFATWLSKVTGVPVGEETFCDDLINGVALCKLMTMLEGSGVTKYHDIPSANGVPMDSWKSKENMAQFQAACSKLKMPVVFGTAELEQKSLFQVASCLLFVVHTASSQGIGIKELNEDEELTERVRAVTEATNEAEAQTPAAPATELSWWQQLLVKFGLGDWLETLDANKLREYAEQIRSQVEAKAAQVQADAAAKQTELKEKVLQQTASFKEQAMSLKDNLPESLKSRLG